MPIKVNYLNNRFDFGVPLEDIFPPNDIHPRLKHLFEEAYILYIDSRFSIEQVVRQLQGSLETRFQLKQRILHDVHYDIKPENIEETPGAYFWLVRHFLGLLPIPLLPKYSQDTQFNWIGLSEKCKNFLQHYESQRDRKCQLDYEFAENLNLLPFEHFILLTVLIHFIRKLSKKTVHGRGNNRRTLLFLCKYYCASICVRPYIPGHKDDKMFPLFFYIVLRWRTIEKYCKQIGHPAYFLQSNLNYQTHTNASIRDNWAQTANFSLNTIPVYKSIPYFQDNNNYLKDTGSQTEHTAYADKGIQNEHSVLEQTEINVEVKHEKLSDQENGSVYPTLPDIACVQIENDLHLTQDATSTPLNEKDVIRGGELFENPEISLLNIEDVACNKDWSDVMKETVGTVKKVESYIYDDYDTFSKEEYNQISHGNKSRGSLFHKVSRIGWTYTPENSAREESKECTNPNEMDNTYVKFEDVFDENGKYKTNDDYENNRPDVKDDRLNITFEKCLDSKTPLCNNSSKSANAATEGDSRSKKTFNLKRFKLKLDFLRVLTPKKVTYSTPSYDSIESNVKYKKIKNIKSNTL